MVSISSSSSAYSGTQNCPFESCSIFIVVHTASHNEYCWRLNQMNQLLKLPEVPTTEDVLLAVGLIPIEAVPWDKLYLPVILPFGLQLRFYSPPTPFLNLTSEISCSLTHKAALWMVMVISYLHVFFSQLNFRPSFSTQPLSIICYSSLEPWPGDSLSQASPRCM